MWAWQGGHLPTRHMDYERLAMRWHAALTEAHGTVDVIPSGTHLDRYQLVVAPALYLMSATTHTWLRSHPGDIILTATSGTVDEHARVSWSTTVTICRCGTAAGSSTRIPVNR
jgi:beta-galactosidase